MFFVSRGNETSESRRYEKTADETDGKTLFFSGNPISR